jgi:hypothetical protein
VISSHSPLTHPPYQKCDIQQKKCDIQLFFGITLAHPSVTYNKKSVTYNFFSVLRWPTQVWRTTKKVWHTTFFLLVALTHPSVTDNKKSVTENLCFFSVLTTATQRHVLELQTISSSGVSYGCTLFSLKRDFGHFGSECMRSTSPKFRNLILHMIHELFQKN